MSVLKYLITVILLEDVNGYLEDLFKAAYIVPDVIDQAPSKLVDAKFYTGKEMRFGNELTPHDTAVPPIIAFESNPGEFYTIMMVDVDYRLSHAGVLHIGNRPHGIWSPPGTRAQKEPWTVQHPDVPSHNNPSKRHWLHWLVGNIEPNSQHGLETAAILADYTGPRPPPGTGTHRYVLLVYRQNAVLQFDEIWHEVKDDAKRSNFNLHAFVDKYGLGAPIAGNFFYASSYLI